MPDMPTDEEIQRLLAEAAAESARNAGAEEVAAHSARLKVRARQSAQRGMYFDMAKTIVGLALAVFIALVVHAVLNMG